MTETERELPLCVSVPRLAAQMSTKSATLCEYAARAEDPLPIRYVKGKERSGFVLTPELYEWLARNTCLYMERREYAGVSTNASCEAR